MPSDDYYKDMKPLDLGAAGYVQLEGEEEPRDFSVSVGLNDTYFDEGMDGRLTAISLEGYCGTTEFGFELDPSACLVLSDIIWSELFKRGITGRADIE